MIAESGIAWLGDVMLAVIGTYAAMGVIFAIGFVLLGVQRMDDHARASPPGFRLLILPGSAALWPLLLRRWLASRARGENP